MSYIVERKKVQARKKKVQARNCGEGLVGAYCEFARRDICLSPALSSLDLFSIGSLRNAWCNETGCRLHQSHYCLAEPVKDGRDIVVGFNVVSCGLKSVECKG